MKEQKQKPKAKKPKYILWAVLLAASVLGAKKAWYYHTHETTDDAQIEARVLPILPKVGGFVEKVMVSENQEVKEGDTLLLLDQREIAAKLAQARAEIIAAEAAAHGGVASASVQSAGSQVAVASANVDMAVANVDKAAKELQRIVELKAKDLASQSQLDMARAADQSARAALKAAQEQQKGASSGSVGARAQLRQADARLAAARANEDYLKLQLEYAVITAPCAGFVSKKSVEQGQLLNPGQPLMSIVSKEKPWVVANLKETQISHLQVGMPVDVEVDAYPGVKLGAKIKSIQYATGARFALLPPDNATGNFTKVVQRIPVRLELDPVDDKLVLRAGMSANIAIPLP